VLLSENGELQAVFVDYLLVTEHTGEGLMGQIYDETFMKKLQQLNPKQVMQQCTGAAFD
jgi:hypothetical protein